MPVEQYMHESPMNSFTTDNRQHASFPVLQPGPPQDGIVEKINRLETFLMHAHEALSVLVKHLEPLRRQTDQATAGELAQTISYASPVERVLDEHVASVQSLIERIDRLRESIVLQ